MLFRLVASLLYYIILFASFNHFRYVITAATPLLVPNLPQEVIIRLTASVNTVELQRLVDYLTYKEATANSKATQEQVDKLAKGVKKGWWKSNRSRLSK